MNNGSDFNFWMPIDIDIQKSGKGKPVMRIKGIASTTDMDTDSEVLEPTGFILDRLTKSGYFNYDHRSRENPMFIVGEPDKAEIRNGQLYVEGNLYDTPLAKDIWEFANVLKKSGSTRNLGFSIEGKAIERDPFNNKRITKALLTGIAITPSPKNANTLMDVVKGNSSVQEYEFDLKKSLSGEDVIFEKEDNGFLYTIDSDLKIMKKAISVETHGGLMLEDLEGVKRKKIRDTITSLQKSYNAGELDESQIIKFKELLKKVENGFGLEKSIMFKSFSADLQSQFPNGGWRTVNGARVFINGGKVVAGLDGFNGMIDDFFKKKEESIKTKENKIEKPSFVDGYWNGKIYGNEKFGFQIYIDEQKKNITNEQKKQLDNYMDYRRKVAGDKKAQEESEKVNASNKDHVLETVYNRIKDAVVVKENMDNLDNKRDLFKKHIKDVFDKLYEDRKKERTISESRISASQDRIFRVVEKNSPEILKELGIENKSQIKPEHIEKLKNVFGNEAKREVSTEGNQLSNELDNLKRTKEGDYEGLYKKTAENIDDNFVEDLKDYITKKQGESAKKEAVRQDKNKIIDNYGGGNWNGKVYGKSGSFSIYLKGDKVSINDSDADILRG